MQTTRADTTINVRRSIEFTATFSAKCAVRIAVGVASHGIERQLLFARSIRHTETYNVIVQRGRIYIYRPASILQSNVIYEADPRDIFNAVEGPLGRKSVT